MFFSPNAAVWYWQDASSITDHGRPLRWAAERFECSSDGRETGRRLPCSRRSRHDSSLQPPHLSPNEPRCDVNVESSSYAYLPAGTQLLLPRIYCCEIDRRGGAAPIWDATVATPRPGHRAAGTPNPTAPLRSRRSRRLSYRRRPHSAAYSEILTDERTETDTQFWGPGTRLFHAHGITDKSLMTDYGGSCRPGLSAHALGHEIAHQRPVCTGHRPQQS
ncbi:hypothetical protein GA0061091_10460 [Gordonia sp. v-85]|nr:hypothetical protein GA0061091_10460 [Gordonia sp. v-85]